MAMATIVRESETKWANYHRTIRRDPVDLRRLVATPGAGQGANLFFAETAAALQSLLAEVAQTQTPLISLGSAWSFSDILAGSGILLHTDIDGAIFAPPAVALRHPAGRRLVLCSGGTTIGALNEWLLNHRLSLITSGSYDGQTVAGACGTGTHGSVLDYGAFQNHVRAVHLVTGPTRSVWIDPEALLDPDYVGTFADRISTDADDFAAALVHLGGLGIVNAVLLEVVEDYRVAVVRRRLPVETDRLRWLADGDFVRFAEAVWVDAHRRYPATPPYFIEVVLNPFARVSPFRPLPRPALVTLFYKETGFALLPGVPDTLRNSLDVIRWYNKNIPGAPWGVPEAVINDLETEPIFGLPPRQLSWGEANPRHDPLPIDLYNAAFAVPRDRLTEALAVMTKAFLANGISVAGPLVFTLRFVRDTAGLLAFTRGDVVVVNLDGIRNQASASSAEDVALALEIADIPFRQHWGKQGRITSKRFVDGYGDPQDAGSRAGRWRAARERLLEPAMLPLIGNDALRGWGLI